VTPVMAGRGDGVEVEHQVRQHRAERTPDDLRCDGQRCLRGGHEPQRAFDDGDDRVEAGRDRLERQDQRHECGAGDQAVLEKLKADVVRREPLGGDARPDNRHNQEPGPDRLRGQPACKRDPAAINDHGRLRETHPVTPPMSAPRSARAADWTR